MFQLLTMNANMLVAVIVAVLLCLKYAWAMLVSKHASFGFIHGSEKYENMFCEINMPKNYAYAINKSLATMTVN